MSDIEKRAAEILDAATPSRSEPRTTCPVCGATPSTGWAEAAHPTAASTDALRAARQLIDDGRDADTGDLWLHREDADKVRAALAATLPPTAASTEQAPCGICGEVIYNSAAAWKGHIAISHREADYSPPSESDDASTD